MSRSFVRPGIESGKNVTPGRLQQLSFKKTDANIKPIDFNLSWRQWSIWKRRTSNDLEPVCLHLWRRGEGYKTKMLKNKWARQFQRREHEVFGPEIRYDARNPFRPETTWPRPVAEDAPLTQFKERYEYALIPRDPWSLTSVKQETSTAVLYRKPDQASWIERGMEHPHDPHPAHWGLTYCILREAIPGLGEENDVVAVNHEQFRMDLHPNRLAVIATKENCELLNVHWDPLYQDYTRREAQGKLMHRQPWIWDQLQGESWEAFTRKDVAEHDARDEPWDGEVERPIFSAEMVAKRKEESQARRAEREAQEQKLKERKKGAAVQMFEL
eukprot:TRINITY_DN15553_c0_g1_i1.p1 TRINITY_DN15553_c0_g1~~TRINITY_DN15553_c0_g1_i1.p1  ORF type:complete len:354 (+),score=76.44 TRINITY_DN15553_c0_g1_i1:79-1062(+)